MQPSTRATNVALGPAKEDLVLTDLWLIVRKRRLLIAGTALSTTSLAVVYAVPDPRSVHAQRGGVDHQIARAGVGLEADPAGAAWLAMTWVPASVLSLPMDREV